MRFGQDQWLFGGDNWTWGETEQQPQGGGGHGFEMYGGKRVRWIPADQPLMPWDKPEARKIIKRIQKAARRHVERPGLSKDERIAEALNGAHDQAWADFYAAIYAQMLDAALAEEFRRAEAIRLEAEMEDDAIALLLLA